MKPAILWHQVAWAIFGPLFVGLAIWWLENRFDAGIAILVLGLILGVGLYIFGNVSGRRDTIRTVQDTMTATADMLHEASRALELKAKAESTIAMNENRFLTQRERDAAQYVDRQVAQRMKQLAPPPDAYTPVWEQQNTIPAASATGFTIYE